MQAELPSAPTPGRRRPWPVIRVDARALAVFFLILAAWLIVWQVTVELKLVSPLAPAPEKVLSRAVDALRDPFYNKGVNNVGIGWQLLSSFQRVLIGFALAALLAVPLGFVIGVSQTASRAVDPFVQVLRPVSPLAWLPIGLAILKDSQRTAIFVIFMSALWPILFNTILGVRSVPRQYLDLARTLEAGRLTVARRVLLPAALPSILTGLRLSLGVAWLVIVAAEMLIGGRGVGYFVWNQWNNLDIASICVAIVLIGLIGLALDRAVRQVERLVAYD